MLRRFVLHWLPLLLWMCVIFGASTDLGSPRHTSRFVRPILLWLNPQMSEETIEKVHYCVRKSAHAIEYAILGILVWRAIRSSPTFADKSLRWHFCLALFAAALFAATDEIHQLFVPGREGTVHDVVLDTCGAGLGLAVVWVLVRLRQRQPG